MADNELKVVLGAEADDFNAQMQKAVQSMVAAAEAFKKAAVVISKAAADMGAAVAGIRTSLKDTATASVAAGKTISELGKAPLQDLRTLDAQIKAVKATLATGFKSDISKIQLQRLDFGTLQGDVQAADRNITNLGKSLGTTSKEFADLNQAAAALPPSIVSASNASVAFSKNLSGMSTQPLQELRTLDAVLTLLKSTLAGGFEVNVDAQTLSPTSFKQAASGVEALRAVIAQLDLSSEHTTATAQQLIATFQSGFSQGAIQELQKAGVSVEDFRAALTGLSGVIGANLTPLISVLDKIQAESLGTAGSVRTVGESIQAMGPLVQAPLFNLQKFDQELRTIKSTLASGFTVPIEKIPLSGADFVGVKGEIVKTDAAVEGMNSSFQRTQQELTGVKAELSPLASMILNIQQAAGPAAASLASLGSGLLKNVQVVDQELAQLKTALSSGLDIKLGASSLSPTTFKQAIVGVELLREVLSQLSLSSEGANASAQELINTFAGGFTKGVITELQQAGVSVQTFRAALSGVGGTAASALSPLLTVLDNVEAESVQTSGSFQSIIVGLQQMGAASRPPINELARLDAELTVIKKNLSSGIQTSIGDVNLKPANLTGLQKEVTQSNATLGVLNATLSQTIAEFSTLGKVSVAGLSVEKFIQAAAGAQQLNAQLASLGPLTGQTAIQAQIMFNTFAQGFKSGIGAELQQAGVSVAQFRAELVALNAASGGVLTPFINVLDTIQAESVSASGSVKSMGASLQTLATEVQAPLFNLQKLDEELRVIKDVLASGFKADISAQEFVGVEGQLKKVQSAVVAVSGSVRLSQREFTNLKSAVAPLASVIIPVDRAATAAAASLSSMGREPLAPLQNLDEELKDIKATLASGFKTNIDKIKLAPVGASFASVATQVGKYSDETKRAEAATKALNSTVAQMSSRVSAVTPATRDAAFALQNVGRIAQDVPFGLIGIQNNITPLFESFVQLSRSAGGGGAALKALVGTLAGPGGLLLAVSIIPAAIQIATSGIANFTKKTHEAKDKAEEFAKTLKTVQEVQAAGAADTTGEIAKVRALAAAVLDTTKSYGERKNALNTLHETNKPYFEDLTLEASSLQKLTGRVNEYTNALIAQAVVKGFEQEIGRVNSELSIQQGVLGTLTNKLNAAQAAFDKFGPDPRKLTAATTEEAGLVSSRVAKYDKLKSAVTEASAAIADQREVIEPLAGNVKTLEDGMNGAINTAIKFKSTTAETNTETSKQDAILRALQKELRGYQKELKTTEELRKDGLLPEFRENDVDALKKNIQRVLGAIDAREVKIKAKPELEIDPVLAALEIDRIEKETSQLSAFAKIPVSITTVINPRNVVVTREEQAGIEAAISAGIPPLIVPLPSLEIDLPKIPPNFAQTSINAINTSIGQINDTRLRYRDAIAQFGTDAIPAINEAVDATAQILPTLLQGITDSFVGLGEGIGEGIANALNGGGIASLFAGAAEGFLKVIGGVLQEVGKQVIAASTLVVALKAALQKAFVDPKAGLIVGIALVAAGAAMKNLKFKVPQLAEGGITTGPTLATIGERNREAIIPLNKLGDVFSPGGVDVEFIGSKVLGADIYQSWRVHHRRESRVN